MSRCTLMCLMTLNVACFRGRWNSPSVTQTDKQNQKMMFSSTREWFKNYPGLAQKVKTGKRRARSLGRYCFLVFIT